MKPGLSEHRMTKIKDIGSSFFKLQKTKQWTFSRGGTM